MHLVADVDGPVRNAIVRLVRPGEDPQDPGCFLGSMALGGGKYVVRVGGHDSAGRRWTSMHEGALGGDVGDPHPRVLFHSTDGRHFGWAASARWLVRLGERSRLAVRDWDDAATWIDVKMPEASALGGARPFVTGATVFFTVMHDKQVGLRLWDAAHGSRRLLEETGATVRAAGDLGTDAIDLVWTQVNGTPPVRDLMTAAFTTDPGALHPRRVRDDPGVGMHGDPWVVGCGLAAHASAGGGIVVVRLSDGRARSLPPHTAAFTLGAPIGLTCAEVFAPALLEGRTSIVAISIDELSHAN
jgi:hypothetical protein